MWRKLKSFAVRDNIVDMAVAIAIGLTLWLAATSSACDPARTEAPAPVPDHVKSGAGSISAVKTTLAKGDYMRSLADAQRVTSKISALNDARAAMTSDRSSSRGLSPDLARALTAIQGRLTHLSKAERLPAGMTPKILARAHRDLASLTRSWMEASDTFERGDVRTAMTRAQSVEVQAAELMALLRMPVPGPLK